MRLLLLCAISFILWISDLNGQPVKEQINAYLEKSELYLKNDKKIDSALFNAVQADLIFKENKVDDYEIERTIELKYFEVFRLLNQKEEKRERLRNLIQLAKQKEGIAAQSYYYNSGRLASAYLGDNMSDSAQKYYRMALEGTIASGKKLYGASAMNNMGIYFLKQQQYDSSVFYFNKAIERLKPYEHQDSMLLVSIKDNLVDYYLWKKDTTKAIGLLEDNIQFLWMNKLYNKRLIRYCFRLFDLYQRLGEEQMAENVLLKIEPIIQDKQNKLSLDSEIQFYEKKLSGLNHKGMDSILKMGVFERLDSLRKKRHIVIKEQQKNKEKVLKTYQKLLTNATINTAKQEVIKAKEANRKKTIFIIFISVAFIAIAILVRLNYKRELKFTESERQLKEKELRLTELENEKLMRDLYHKSNDFSDLVMQVSLKEDWNQEIIEKLEFLRKGKKEIDANDINIMIRELKQKSQAYDRVSLQQKGIKEVNSAFFSRLDEKHPDLTKSERELCGLIRLNLDGKEIAVIRNINPSSVRKLRHRLRKKLALDAEQDIYEFIRKV